MADAEADAVDSAVETAAATVTVVETEAEETVVEIEAATAVDATVVETGTEVLATIAVREKIVVPAKKCHRPAKSEQSFRNATGSRKPPRCRTNSRRREKAAMTKTSTPDSDLDANLSDQ